jgi:undecaprenyl-phosphate 4-deoxy-4-formamido-L-arabinose transferase
VLLSIVIPVYNGEKTIMPLFDQIKAFCEKNQFSFEVVFVWDCGPDKSWDVIVSLKKQFPDLIKAVRLSRNYGQHNALICGFAHAEGEFFITMDEDLQHIPDDIFQLFQKQIEKDYDVVYGHYETRNHSHFRNFTSSILKRIIRLSIPDLNEDYSAFRIIKSNIAKSTMSMRNSYTFLDGYLSWITTHTSSCLVSHQKRVAGKSSYTIKKLITHSINIFITFSDLPIKIVTWSSFVFFLFTIIYSIWILFQKLFYKNLVPGFASMIILISLGVGFILMAIGILGQYLHRINMKTTKRPNYMESEILV